MNDYFKAEIILTLIRSPVAIAFIYYGYQLAKLGHSWLPLLMFVAAFFVMYWSFQKEGFKRKDK